MKPNNCELCAFENPKPTATAIIIHDQKILVAKRNEEPFLGEWDFIGGFLQKDETPEEALKREIREELGVEASCTYIGAFSGTTSYHDFVYPIISFVYLTELSGDIVLNKKENSKIAWVPLWKLGTVAFDSNKKILKFLQERFSYDLKQMKLLITQLDPTAEINERSLYKAMTNGYISTIKESRELVGMGWIFPRQTLLRRQAVVEDMIVAETHRGQGFGEKILLDLLNWAKKEGIEVVELTTNPHRVSANKLYQKVGFQLHPTNHYLLDMRSWRRVDKD